MGLFSQLPEEPAEWTGIPSEPSRRETEAERLPDAAPAVDVLDLVEGRTMESIVIPVAGLVDAAQGRVEPAEGDAR